MSGRRIYRRSTPVLLMDSGAPNMMTASYPFFLYRQHVYRHKVGALFGQNMEIDAPSVVLVHTAGVATVPSAPVRSLHHLTIRPYSLILR